MDNNQLVKANENIKIEKTTFTKMYQDLYKEDISYMDLAKIVDGLNAIREQLVDKGYHNCSLYMAIDTIMIESSEVFKEFNK